MNLSKYCRENGLVYGTVIYRMAVKNMSFEDAVYKGKYNSCFYLKDGRMVYKLLNKKQYNMFIKRVDKGMTIDEAYEDTLKCSGKPKGWSGTKYWVDGMPLKEYCKKNNLNYNYMLKQQRKKK